MAKEWNGQQVYIKKTENRVHSIGIHTSMGSIGLIWVVSIESSLDVR